MGVWLVPGVIERELAQLARPRVADVPVSDHGINGAIPLGRVEWTIPSDLHISDAEWSTQNRGINDLLAGRA